MTTLPNTSRRHPVETEIEHVGRDLAASIRSILNSLPGAPHRQQSLTRTLRINKDLASRVLSAVQQTEPMAVVHGMPGPVPLARLLDAVARHGSVSDAQVEQARSAVRRFDQLIRTRAGDRAALDAMISSHLPSVRSRFELESKQAAFKAMSQLIGGAAELSVNTVVLHPSAQRNRHDLMLVMGFLGLRRVRPAAAVKFHSVLVSMPCPVQRLTLEGQATTDVDALRLDEFCSVPAPIERVELEDRVVYTLGPGPAGRQTSWDVLLAELQPHAMAVYRPPDYPGEGDAFISSEATLPVKALLFDVIAHEQCYADVTPSLRIFDTSINGMADPNDPRRSFDQLELAESIESLGDKLRDLDSTYFPRYAELIQHCLARSGWQHETFRCFRCLVEYPVYGSQMCMTFARPPLPAGEPL
jgi:hypothetical protein